MDSKAVIVLGMHRSGTSALTRGLLSLGVDLGGNLSGSGPDNPTGFWEDQSVVSMNELLLHKLKLQWNSLSDIDWSQLLQQFSEEMNVARQLVVEQFSSSTTWGIKDPRIVRLLPFWVGVFDQLGLDVRFVVSLRHPLFVAQSLLRRNGIPLEKGALLWLRYYLDIVRHLNNKKSIIVQYDDLLKRPQDLLGLLASKLSIPFGENAKLDMEKYSGEFLDAGLDHGVVHSGSTGPALILAEKAYQFIQSVSDQDIPFSDEFLHSGWTRLEKEFSNFSVLFPLLEGMEEEIRTLKDRYRDFDVSPGVDELLKHKENLLCLKDERIEFVESELKSKESESINKNIELKSKESELINKNIELKSKEAKLNTLEQELVKEKNEICQLKLQIENLVSDNWSLLHFLDKERYSIMKPILRRGVRIGKGLLETLPQGCQQPLRNLKNRLHPSPLEKNIRMSLGATSGSLQEETAGVFGSVLPAAQHPCEKSDFFVLPVIDWHFRIQRPQQIARELAKSGHRVFYFCTTFSPAGAFPQIEVKESPESGVFICQLSCPHPVPNIYQSVFTQEHCRWMLQAIDELIRTCGIGGPQVIVDLPVWSNVAKGIPGAKVIYDCMDHHAGFSTNNVAMLQQEEYLLKTADLVLSSSQRLSDMVAEKAANILIRNAAEVDFFKTPPKELLYCSDRMVVGYYGAISDWFDMDLVCVAAKKYPEWDFVLVGDTVGCNLGNAKKISNIHFIGEVPYGDLPGYLHAFDVCMIPFKVVELTLCTNPVKIYEYLAAGKPTVATALPELELIADNLHLAEGPEKFVSALNDAMLECRDPQLKEQRTRWASQHDWRSRAEMLEEAVDRLTPRASVIVLTYNNLEFTKACLDSLQKNTCYLDWELIIVDNASTDGTREFLNGFGAENPKAKIILNQDNLGFAAGNNVGMKVATGDYLVVLNNDTFVTRGWLSGLIGHLQRNEKLGMVGPVTNNIGNEAKIDVHYASMEEMETTARSYTLDHVGELFKIDTLGFFCVAMSRSVMESVGLLDEAFKVGFFEDDDYCRRVKMSGYDIAVAEDVFVHHHLSASFDKLENPIRQKIFEENKAIYEKKWGKWVPHNYR